jgi:hypothetical protein
VLAIGALLGVGFGSYLATERDEVRTFTGSSDMSGVGLGIRDAVQGLCELGDVLRRLARGSPCGVQPYAYL